ncbi:MAG: hypothetical protein H6852_17535 [Geminicoccaceae bacterium]|nr:hypothetical protein [Geminicoccaceae bacterium]HRY24881.1 hypothetical protein [Geminicoccaceae bacterium]
MISRAGQDPQVAFRAGLAHAATPGNAGPGERLVLRMQRLPGLVEPGAAFEVGRALRAIARLFDRAAAPVVMVEQFRDNLVGAAIAQRGRLERNGRCRRGWNLQDTIEMFVEMYERLLGQSATGYAEIRGYVFRAAAGPAPLMPLPASRVPPRFFRRAA